MDGQWYPLKSCNLEDEFRSTWNENCPAHLENCDPPFLTELFAPGLVQIWTGYFVETRPGWSLLIRPPVNCGHRSGFTCFEGLMETDVFRPAPLFIIIKIHKTDQETFLPADKPLFQIQLVRTGDWKRKTTEMTVSEGLDWEGVSGTIRRVADREVRPPGNYARASRKSPGLPTE